MTAPAVLRSPGEHMESLKLAAESEAERVNVRVAALRLLIADRDGTRAANFVLCGDLAQYREEAAALERDRDSVLELHAQAVEDLLASLARARSAEIDAQAHRADARYWRMWAFALGAMLPLAALAGWLAHA